jgi:hypothetical protein
LPPLVVFGPGFPENLVDVGELHAVPASRDRTRGRIQRSEQEIRDLRRPQRLHF